jgi:succinate dehydrogenase / fumarate reductase cytochrome b subunit
MANPSELLRSSVGKKLLTGLTGVALVAFIVLHMAGNLWLFAGPDAFNGYAHKLHGFGALLYVAEIGLLVLFAAHAASTLTVYADSRRARPVANVLVQGKGAPSRQTVASRSMIVTGSVLLVFVVLHVIHFRFGPAEPEGYVTTLHGEPARDLYRLVVEAFRQPLVVAAYMAVMVLLALHLRHGVWSAFQSLGALNPALRTLMYGAALGLSVIIGAAFFVMPLYLHLYGSVPGPSVSLLP